MSAPAPIAHSTSLSIRRVTRWVATFILIASVSFWAVKGAHRGWSQNQVPVKQTDEITGLEYVTYEKRFVPGVEVLGGGLAFAAGLFIVSFFFNRKNNQPPI